MRCKAFVYKGVDKISGYCLTGANGTIRLVMEDDIAYWLIYCLLRLRIRVLRTKYRHAYLHRSATPTHCQICNKYLPYSQRSIDHIIPKELCYKLEWPLLILDERNFQVLCHSCNRSKSAQIKDLPQKVLEAIRKRQNELMKRDSLQRIVDDKLALAGSYAENYVPSSITIGNLV